MKRQGAALELPIEGGLPGYAPPPPLARERFRLSPGDNGVFTLLDSPRVRRLYAEIPPAIQERCQASMRIRGAVGPAPVQLGHGKRMHAVEEIPAPQAVSPRSVIRSD